MAGPVSLDSCALWKRSNPHPLVVFAGAAGLHWLFAVAMYFAIASPRVQREVFPQQCCRGRDFAWAGMGVSHRGPVLDAWARELE
jgi:hypothetical protein